MTLSKNEATGLGSGSDDSGLNREQKLRFDMLELAVHGGSTTEAAAPLAAKWASFVLTGDCITDPSSSASPQ